MTSLAISCNDIYKAESSALLRGLFKNIDVIFDSPSDIFIAAFPETICNYIRKKLPDVYSSADATLLHRNSHKDWFDFLQKQAKPIEKIGEKINEINCFTFSQNKAIMPESNKLKGNKMEETKRKRIDKSLKIYKMIGVNPRKEGSHGHKSFSLIVDGMSVAEYLQIGGRMNDLQWEIKHNRIELKA